MTLWDQPGGVTLNVNLPGLRVGRHLTIQERFEEWLLTPDGLLVYGEVVARANRLASRGWTHFAIGALWESIRYDHSVRVGPEGGFKLNDHYRSRMARRVMLDYPMLDGFFETRELRA